MIGRYLQNIGTKITRFHHFGVRLRLFQGVLNSKGLILVSSTSSMDIQTLLHNLHEEVSCSVCMTKFTDPKQLPCLHSFCLHCLQGIQRTSGIRETISCPECRQNFRIPGDGDLNALPTNFRINSLLDVLAIKECNTSGVKCGNCDKRSGESFYCFQCCSFWCDDCISLHNGIRANKEHHALALKDFQDRDFENILKRPTFCGKPGHEKKEMEFFCKSCKVAICYSCIATLHEGHPKILLDEAANERKMQVKSAIVVQREKLLQERNKITKLQSNCVNIQAQVESVKRNAQNFADKMKEAIEAKKLEIFNGVEKKAGELIARMEIQQLEVENHADAIETAIERKETLLKRSANAEIVRLDTIFQERVCDQQEQLEDLRHFIFVEDETLLYQTNSRGIGGFRAFVTETKADQSIAGGKGIREVTIGLEAQIVLTTRNAQGEQCYEEHDCVTVEIRNRQGHECATKAQVQDNKDGSYNVSYFAKETGTCQASVKVNGEHVRGSPFEVQVKPRQFRPVLSFGQKGSSDGMFYFPWGVAVNEHVEIAVTDRKNHRIQVFSSNGTHLRSFGSKGNQPGQFDEATGIAFLNDNIVVVDRNNHRLQILSAQGEFLSQFGEKGILDHQLNLPLGLSIDSENNIIVADPRNKIIKTFSSSGKLVRKIGGDGSLAFPFHCIQQNNLFIVSDMSKETNSEPCIKVFDREGNYLYTFGKQGDGDGQFDRPRCLSVSKEGRLIVCDCLNNGVQVLQLSGRFVTKFGAKGQKIGEFNNPISSAVLTDGRIVVSDYENHRIQIFE